MAASEQKGPEESTNEQQTEEQLIERLESGEEKQVLAALLQSKDLKLLAVAARYYIRIYQETEDGDLEALDNAEDLLDRIIQVS